jgi:hypothetical protein
MSILDDLTKSALAASTSATSTASSTTLSKQRLQNLSNTIQTDVPSVTSVNPNTYYTQDIITNFNTLPPSTSTASADQVGVTQPIGYKFNLPPHDWSLPVRPADVDPDIVGYTDTASFHGLRRGRLWYWAGANNNGPWASTANTGPSTPLNLIDTAYGFQFLWNPTTISTSVARNMNVTPSSADALRVVSGVFPGQETVSLSIVIDRTNDFACIRAEAQNAALDVRTGVTQGASPITNNLGAFSRYYNSLYPGASVDQNMNTQIATLMSQGTMADLEYLFKAINGSGNGNLEWTTLLGKKTANVGYLAPTLLGIQLGPTIDNLSYVGWASNISINHTAFTETMVPIRTEVSIAIQCFSGSGLTSGV